MNRKDHFYKLFIIRDLTVREVAELMNLKQDSLYRKLNGTNGFNEKDIKTILKILDMDFKEVFI